MFIQYERVGVASHLANSELEAQRSRSHYHSSAYSDKGAAFSVRRLVVLVRLEQGVRFEGAIFRRVVDRKLRACVQETILIV